MKNIAIFASGTGTNAENITRYFKGSLNVHVAVVLSNNQNVEVHARVNQLGIPSFVFTRDEFNDGQVILDGMEWSARAYEEGNIIPAGAVVEVKEIRGVKLMVMEKGKEQ